MVSGRVWCGVWACGRYVSAGGCHVVNVSTSSTYYTLTVCKVLVVGLRLTQLSLLSH